MSIRFTRIIGAIRFLRAGLREAARVLAQALWSSGLRCKFACLMTIIQSEWPAYNPFNPIYARITLITITLKT